MPSANGNYAVIVTKDGYVAFSPCVAVTNVKVQAPSGSSHEVKVFPNPSTGMLHIEFGRLYSCASVSIVSMQGTIHSSYTIDNSTTHGLDL